MRWGFLMQAMYLRMLEIEIKQGGEVRDLVLDKTEVVVTERLQKYGTRATAKQTGDA